MKTISIIVPCYNEADGLSMLIERVNSLIQTLPNYNVEVIAVDDGSADNTFSILVDACNQHPWLKALKLTRNFGKEAALTAGLDCARGDALVFMDADLQHPPELINEFLEHWEKGAEVVVARRVSRDADSHTYRLLAETFYRLHRRISHIEMPANVGDFRLIDRRVGDQLKQLRESQRFMKGLFAWVGYSPVFVDYDVPRRPRGDSKFNKWKAWNLALEGITSFSTIPLRVWSYVGGFVLMLGICYSSIIIFLALAYGVRTPGYVTLITIIIIFGGIQLIGIGILGEYIGRIYMEVKGRPPYLVGKEVAGCGRKRNNDLPNQ